MKLREKYREHNKKGYDELKEFFFEGVLFSKGVEPCEIKNKLVAENRYVSRVWLLFASNDEQEWECLQVAQSKGGVKGEVESVIDYLLSGNTEIVKSTSYHTNSAFYEMVCPSDIPRKDYREALYCRIGSDYSHFMICFLNVDKYLGIELNKENRKTDGDRIVEICKNQYAEAKIAYKTLAVYWRLYPSGIDGQTISYIAEHPSEYED